MTTNFPSSADNFTNPQGTDPVNNPSHAQQHDDINDAVHAVQSYLLTNLPSSTTYIASVEKGQAGGVAELDGNGQVPINQLGNIIDGAPTALNTLNELALALNDDASYATTITTALGNRPTYNGAGYISNKMYLDPTIVNFQMENYINNPTGFGYAKVDGVAYIAIIKSYNSWASNLSNQKYIKISSGLPGKGLYRIFEPASPSFANTTNFYIYKVYEEYGSMPVGLWGTDAFTNGQSNVSGEDLEYGSVTQLYSYELSNLASSSSNIQAQLDDKVSSISIVNAADTSYSVTSSNFNQWINATGSGNQTFSISTVASETKIGQQIIIYNKNGNTVSINGASGVTVESTGETSTNPSLRARYSAALLVYQGSQTWSVVGDIA